MARFAIGGILSSSTFLLRFAAYLGFFFLILNMMTVILYIYITTPVLVNSMLIMDAMYVIFFIDVIAIYLARIYKDGVDRPVFIVDWKQSALNGSSPAGDSVARRVWTTNKTSMELESQLEAQVRNSSQR